MTTKQITVAAPEGLRCPMEHGGIITDVPVRVPETRFYRRLIADGSLVIVPEQKPAKTVSTKKRQEAVHDDKQ